MSTEEKDGQHNEDTASDEVTIQEAAGDAIEPEIEETSTDESTNGALQAELDEATQQLLRVRADFDNFRRRTRQEKEDLQKFASRKLLTDLLPVVDNFDRALQSMDADASNTMKSGMEMVYRQLVQILDQQGVETIDPTGQAFDPNLHEAVMQEPAEAGQESGIVSAVLQKGYMLHGKVLRPAMVKVTV